MRRYSFIAALCWLSGSAFAQRVWTLEECLSYSQRNNLRVQQSAVIKEKSQLQLNTARNLFLPEVDLRWRTASNWGFIVDPSTNVLSHRFNLGNQLSLNAGMDLFKGFANINQVRLRKQEVAVASYRDEAEHNDIALQTAMGYLQVLLANEQWKSARQRLKNLTDQQSQVKAQVNKEILTKRDLLNIQSQVATEELQMVYAENSIEQATFNLMQVMGLPPGETLRVDTLRLPEPDLSAIVRLEEAMTASEMASPESKQAKAEVEVSYYNWRIAQANVKPTLSLAAQLGTRSSNFKEESFGQQFTHNLNEQIGLALYVPIFNRGIFRNTIEIAKLDLTASKIAARQANEDLQRRMMSAFLEHKAALRKYQALQQQHAAISEEFRYSQKSWMLGSISSGEFSLTRTKLVDSQSAVLQAKYDCLFRQMILSFLQGNPLTY